MSKVVRSTANPGVKRVLKLRTRRARRESGLFLVEGFREIRRALEAGIGVETMWFCPELYLGQAEDDLVAQAEAAGADVVQTTEAPFRRMSYRDRPEGLLAVCRQFDTSLDHIAPGPLPLVLVVESIEKPGNLGTMIRTATAAGADAVIAADPTTDVFNPNVVRSSIGTCFLIPIAVASTDDTIEWLRKRSVAICAASPDADAAIWEAPLTESSALVVGSEQYGLSEAFRDAADVRMRIPMPSEAIDSLNAAASAAVVLFEAVRQRSL